VKETLVHTYISDVLAGNTHAFGHLVDGYKDMVYSVCIKITSDPELAEEVAQDVFVKAYQGLNKFKGNSKFSTWIYQIAYFTSINAVRQKKIEKADLIVADKLAANEDCLDHLEASERKELIQEALLHLKADERGVITLYYLEELSIEEVSKITRLSISNVKVKVHRSRKKLYGILEKMLKEEFNTLKHE
jgi:RNA polymerase sigma-70 factor (ECF subfamily)